MSDYIFQSVQDNTHTAFLPVAPMPLRGFHSISFRLPFWHNTKDTGQPKRCSPYLPLTDSFSAHPWNSAQSQAYWPDCKKAWFHIWYIVFWNRLLLSFLSICLSKHSIGKSALSLKMSLPDNIAWPHQYLIFHKSAKNSVTEALPAFHIQTYIKPVLHTQWFYGLVCLHLRNTENIPLHQLQQTISADSILQSSAYLCQMQWFPSLSLPLCTKFYCCNFSYIFHS